MFLRFKILILLPTIFLLVFNLAFAHGEEEHDFRILMSDDGFNPERIEINSGDTIVFENISLEDRWPASNIHPTHLAYSDFDPRSPILPNDSWSFTFDKEGEWEFHDHLFPMYTGVIVVKDFDKNTSSKKETGKVASFFKKIFMKISSFFSREGERGSQSSKNVSSVNTVFKEPSQYSPSLIEKFEIECEPRNHKCISDSLKELIKVYGPVAGVEALTLAMNKGSVHQSVNDHQLSHEIGRETARVYGVNNKAFLLCPMSAFNGGCQHGFFEYVLGKTETSAEAADLICASLGDEFSSKFKFYCYHGVGHGVMMAEAYDLKSSLDTCDTFSEYSAQEGCWQGVFMENTNAGTGGFARDDIFSDKDPLLPCRNLDDKYKHQCYINHAGYLMYFFRNDVQEASLACMEADEKWVDACLQSIGLMVTNPVWQGSLLKGKFSNSSFERKAWEICKMFPEEKQKECVLGGVDNIVNFDEFDVSRADNFCSLVGDKHNESCYRMIGTRLKENSIDDDSVRESCNKLSSNGINYCLEILQ